MSRRPTLDQLIDYAQAKADDAARALGALNTCVREAEHKLQLLIQYRDEYFLRFRETAAQGIDNHRLGNFRAFMEKLDTAIAEQHKVLADARHGARAAQNRWQVEQQRLKSYEVLAERRHSAEKARTEKRERREHDEYAATIHRRNRASA